MFSPRYFPDLLAREILSWENFKINIALAQHINEKNENQHCYLKPRFLQCCGLEHVFY